MLGPKMNALFGGKAVPPPDQTGVPRTRPGRRLAIQQALDLQELVFDTAFQEGTKAADRAQLVRAWACLQEEKRILRGRLKPGTINATIPHEPKMKQARCRPNRIVDVDRVVRSLQAKAQQSAEIEPDNHSTGWAH